MGDSFFECPWVWLVSLCVLALVLLARCEEREPYDPYAWQGAQPDGADGYALEVYEYEMVPGFAGTESRSVYAEATPLRNSGESEMLANSLPPTGNWE